MPRSARPDASSDGDVSRNIMGREPGAYLILFRLPELKAVKIGRLGIFDLEPGQYAYVGSAMGGLGIRIRRHLRGFDKKHWHIDYLMERALEREAFLVPSLVNIECLVAGVVRELEGVRTPIHGFGSSDCHCPSHLFLLGDESVRVLKKELSGAWKGCKIVRRDDL